MQILRAEVYELILYERQFNREKNARYRLMERVLAACLKVIDLWEQYVEYMKIIDNKKVEINDMNTDLEKRTAKRLGLESDNAGLQRTKTTYCF